MFFYRAAAIRPKLAMHDKHGNNGPVIDMMSYPFTLWRYALGSEPKLIKANGITIAADAEDLPASRTLLSIRRVLAWSLPRGILAQPA